MARDAHDDTYDAAREGRKLSRSLGWLTFLGVLLVLAGVVGLFYTGLATLTSMLLFGWLLLIGGVVGLLHAIESRGTSYFWLAVVVAALNIAAGVVVIRHPEGSAEALTMFAALLFLTGGVFRLVGSVVVRGPQFGWTLLQGAFGLLLGLLVLFDWPESSRYVLGVFFSLALLFDGLGLIAIGVGGRRIVSMVTPPDTPAGTSQDASQDASPGTSPGTSSDTAQTGPPKMSEGDQEQSNN
ncbi:HdeD family acid-resistance protein [Streptomyces sp. Je 1-79]|uniref:HdeD family acid-resistance protein n=1 Tax=Streptomyces sp. Je 1-79 TaxID=2943847 RepID=UPI0021A289FC|nr:HdeD family acid-resistance protein [Streptomyces sp. Je 1-79]MCT4353271.1 HdeD family acid-resistance protein [Streptomyces sp. Je 1-79]